VDSSIPQSLRRTENGGLRIHQFKRISKSARSGQSIEFGMKNAQLLLMTEVARKYKQVLKARNEAFTFTEVIVAAFVVLTVALVTTQSMLTMNQRAAESRLRTNAQVVVERSIQQAIGSAFTDTSSPQILTITPETGVAYDDSGKGDNVVEIMVQKSGGPAIVTGRLTRIVRPVANPENADIRRVTFRLLYTFRGKPSVYEMSTLRAKS
jgi:type II secretory pathway pseudopilin PulG